MPATHASTGGAETAEKSAIGERVAAVFNALQQLLRAYEMYGPGNAQVGGRLSTLRDCFRSLWEYIPELTVAVSEDRLVFDQMTVHEAERRSGSLPFLFYKDSVRVITFLPGFEERDIDAFVQLLLAAQNAHDTEEDLLTLLWAQDFTAFRYQYVELAEGEDAPHEPATGSAPGDASSTMLSGTSGAAPDNETLPADASETPPHSAAGPPSPAAAAAAPAPWQDPVGLPESVHAKLARPVSLGPEDLEALGRAIEAELQRDVEIDVVNALLDLLEDPDEAIRAETLQVVAQLLPRQLAAGETRVAVHTLRELSQVIEEGRFVDALQQVEVERIVRETVALTARPEFWQSLFASENPCRVEDLELLLRPAGGDAFGTLLGASTVCAHAELREVIRDAAQRVAVAHPGVLATTLVASDPQLLTAALALAVPLGRIDLVPVVGRLLKHPELEIQRAAIQTLVAFGVPAAMDLLVPLLEHENRDIRLAAAWGVGTWQHAPALPALEAILTAREFRSVALGDKLALVDAYARAGGVQSVPLLHRLLNGRRVLRHRETPDVRACAARALGSITAPEAQAALQKAVDDAEPAVRTAVKRALQRSQA